MMEPHRHHSLHCDSDLAIDPATTDAKEINALKLSALMKECITPEMDAE